MNPSIVIYDQDMKKVAYLQNAFKITYEKKLNALWLGSFTLPADDEKNQYCKPFHYVEIFDEGRRVELFRILPAVLTKARYGTITYQCEHVLATLIDDVLFQYHEIGGLGTYTSEIIQYILSKQSKENWVMGECDFTRQFQYSWENENLFSALLSIPKAFDAKYKFTFDTTVYPWVLNLKEIDMSQHPKSYIRYRKNQKSITRTVDPTNLCTRLYGLGYGEGVNQLSIAEVNGGIPYIDADTMGVYGVKADFFVDKRFTNAANLKARVETLLNERKHPQTTYVVEGADLYSIEGEPYGNFEPGTLVRCIDDELKIDVKQIIYNVAKSDVRGNPGAAKLIIANAPQNIGTLAADLMRKQRISDVYAQGATNIDNYNFADNCDPENPAVLKFYVPEEAVRINKLRLTYEVTAFRAYSKATKGGGAIATTTEAGGGAITSTAAGGGAVTSSEESGNHEHVIFLFEADEPPFFISEKQYLARGTNGLVQDVTLKIEPYDGGDDYTSIKTYTQSGTHTHVITIPSHIHVVVLPDHYHIIELPNHVHEIEYGIFLNPVLSTAITVEVDGSVIPGLTLNETDVDIIPYLAKDGSGKILRGMHEIKITPNNLGRVTADAISQFFIQSRGGGDY